MHRRFPLLAAAFAFALSPAAFAQQPQTQPAAPAQQAQVTDDQLVTFAEIYVDMQKRERKLADRIAEAGSQDAARDAHRDAEREMIGVIEEHGWTVDQYNTVAEAINADQQLRLQAIALIQERS
jgi:hypothetical protein